MHTVNCKAMTKNQSQTKELHVIKQQKRQNGIKIIHKETEIRGKRE